MARRLTSTGASSPSAEAKLLRTAAEQAEGRQSCADTNAFTATSCILACNFGEPVMACRRLRMPWLGIIAQRRTGAVACDGGDDAQHPGSTGLFCIADLQRVQDPVADQHRRLHRLAHRKQIRQTCKARTERWARSSPHMQQAWQLRVAGSARVLLVVKCGRQAMQRGENWPVGVASESVSTATASAPAATAAAADSASCLGLFTWSPRRTSTMTIGRPCDARTSCALQHAVS